MKLKLWIATAGLVLSGYAAAADNTAPVAGSTTAQPAPDADNTGRNKQKQDVNADKQSNAKADVELVAKIRKAVLADESLSVNAHNVKIVTKDGTVHLDGAVESEAEKKKVEDIVRRAAGGSTVQSELDVAKK